MRRRQLLFGLIAVSGTGLLAACAPAPAAPPTSAPAATAEPAAPVSPAAVASAPAASPAAVAASPAGRPVASPSPVAQGAPAAIGGHVKLGAVSFSAANAGIWSADEGGYLKKYGVDGEVVQIADSTQAVPAILSGEVPLNCGLSGTAVVASALGGADLAFYAVTVNTFPSSLYVRSSIESMQDLKGAKIAVPRFGTAPDTAIRIVLRRNNLDPAKDVTLLQLGGLPEILTGLQSGQVDGGVLSAPTTVQARQAGFRELVDIGTLGIEYAFNGVVATRAFARQNAALMEGVLKAIVEGVHRFKTDQAFGKMVVQKRGNLTDQATIDETWRVFGTGYLKEPPFPTDAGIQTVLDELAPTNPKAQGASPSSFYDDSVLNKLQDSGFIKSVLG